MLARTDGRPQTAGKMVPPPAKSSVAEELETFLGNLRDFACGGRPVEAREIQLARRELAARDERISRLEQSLNQREELKLLMVKEQQALLLQLEDARSLVHRVQAAGTARLEAEAQARSVLAGSPSAQELLARELAELQEAEDRARKAREARREAALRRKAAIEAEVEARQGVQTGPGAERLAASACTAGDRGDAPARQALASAVDAPLTLSAPPASSPSVAELTAAAAVVTAVGSASLAEEQAHNSQAMSDDAFLAATDGEDEDQSAAAQAAVDAALAVAATPALAAAAEPFSEDDFDTMGWPATAQPPGVEDVFDGEDDTADLMAQLRAEVQAAALPASTPALIASVAPPVAPSATTPMTPFTSAADVRQSATFDEQAAHRPAVVVRLETRVVHIAEGVSVVHTRVRCQVGDVVFAPSGRASRDSKQADTSAAAPAHVLPAAMIAAGANAPVLTAPVDLHSGPTEAARLQERNMDEVPTAASHSQATSPPTQALPPALVASAQAPATQPGSIADDESVFDMSDDSEGEDEYDDYLDEGEEEDDYEDEDDDAGAGIGVMSPAPVARPPAAATTPAAAPVLSTNAAPIAASSHAPEPAAEAQELLEAARVQAQEYEQSNLRAAKSVAVLDAALQSALSQEEEAQRMLKDVQAELERAQQAERQRKLQQAAREVPRKRGLMGVLARSKKPAGPDVADSASPPELSRLVAKVGKYESVARSLQEARVRAGEERDGAQREAEQAAVEHKSAIAHLARQQELVQAAKLAVTSSAPPPTLPPPPAPVPTVVLSVPASVPQPVPQPAMQQLVAPIAPSLAAPVAPLPASPVVHAVQEALQPVSSVAERDVDDYADGGSDEDVDSDFELSDDAEELADPPLLQDHLRLAKLYGHNGLGNITPPDNIICAPPAPPRPAFMMSFVLLLAPHPTPSLSSPRVSPTPGERRWVVLRPDASLWHADEQLPGQTEMEAMGRLDLASVFACECTGGGEEQLCLSQTAKCHLLKRDPSSTTNIHQWRDAISMLMRALREG